MGSEPASKVFSGGRAATCLLAVLLFFSPRGFASASVSQDRLGREKEGGKNQLRRYCRNLVRWFRRNLVRRYRRNLVTLRIIFLVRPGQDMMA